MSSYLFVGGPLDGQYREVEDPPPTCVPYIVPEPYNTDYAPDAIAYIALPADMPGTDPEVIVYTIYDEAELQRVLTAPKLTTAEPPTFEWSVPPLDSPKWVLEDPSDGTHKWVDIPRLPANAYEYDDSFHTATIEPLPSKPHRDRLVIDED
jgi:hypothetical protein